MQDVFTNWYIRCALWASTTDDDTPMDDVYTAEDLSPEALLAITDDCDKFQRENWDLIARDIERAACDFWLTRNHHGAGFWDGDWGDEDGEKLTQASQAYPEVCLYVGDDGQVHIGPA